MADIFPFLIDGRAFPDIPVIDFDILYDPLDGPGTGRMESIRAPLFRDPYGTFVGADVLCGLPMNHHKNKDFIDLITILIDFGRPGHDFKELTIVTPLGPIVQNMYSASFRIKGRKVYRDGETYWGTIPIQFRAEEAYYY